MKKISFASFACLLALCSCAPQLTILHLNDTHSHHEPLRSGELAGHGGIVELAAVVDSLRGTEKNLVLLHAGDFNQGSSYYTEMGGSFEVDVMNIFRFDAVALGNHEFDNGLEDLAARLGRIQSPFVCANIDFTGTPLEQVVKPCTVIRRRGWKIGVIGLAPQMGTMVSASVSAMIRQTDDAEAVNRWSEYLRRREHCNCVILLTHIGNEEDKALVPSLHGIDLVVGGHSHTFINEPDYVSDADGRLVPVVTDGKWGLEAGLIKIKK